MKIQTSINSSYLLESSFERLHKESREWISELNFWKDDISFLTKTLRNNHMKAIDEGKGEIYNVAFAALTRLQNTVLNKLKTDILDNEELLAEILISNQTIDDSTYYDNHKLLAIRVKSFKKKYTDAKREFFIIMEDWP